jgi:hypothetical protein
MSLRLVATLAASCLAACTQMEVDGLHVTGLFTPVHAGDVRAAVVAANAAKPRQRGKIYEVQVVSSSEMHIYREPKTEIISYQVRERSTGNGTQINALS